MDKEIHGYFWWSKFKKIQGTSLTARWSENHLTTPSELFTLIPLHGTVTERKQCALRGSRLCIILWTFCTLITLGLYTTTGCFGELSFWYVKNIYCLVVKMNQSTKVPKPCFICHKPRNNCMNMHKDLCFTHLSDTHQYMPPFSSQKNYTT